MNLADVSRVVIVGLPDQEPLTLTRDALDRQLANPIARAYADGWIRRQTEHYSAARDAASP